MANKLIFISWILQPVCMVGVIFQGLLAEQFIEMAISEFYIALGTVQVVQYLILLSNNSNFRNQMRFYGYYLVFMGICVCIPFYGWLVVLFSSPVAAIMYFIVHTIVLYENNLFLLKKTK